MRALKRRLNHKNPNVQNLALGVCPSIMTTRWKNAHDVSFTQLTDICVKNGGDHFLFEIASREFMDNLVSILKIPALNLEVKNNILRLVQNWSVAFEGKPTLTYMGTVYKALTNEGEHNFQLIAIIAQVYQATSSHPRISLPQIQLW
jgi:hepatocyte growth factor-regulated tyrosine kinase substrate